MATAELRPILDTFERKPDVLISLLQAIQAEFSRIHGNDERINVEAFKRGVIDHLAIIATVVYD